MRPNTRPQTVFHRSLALVLTAAVSVCTTHSRAEDETAPLEPAAQTQEDEIVITIVYDNNPGREGLTTAWGFAAMIQGLEKTILFDTGGEGRILMNNLNRLNLDPKEVDLLVLSHIHGDHTGGVPAFSKVRRDIPVYVPEGFDPGYHRRLQNRGMKPVEAAESMVILPDARTTGTLGRGAIEEHALCVKTREGWVLITGCAHPGVANLAARAKEVTGGPIHLVVGGFHMGGDSEAQINATIDRLEELGVQRVAPAHCTGDAARALFKQRLGDRCTLPGVGSVFRLARAP